jgi:hypothetical protein
MLPYGKRTSDLVVLKLPVLIITDVLCLPDHGNFKYFYLKNNPHPLADTFAAAGDHFQGSPGRREALDCPVSFMPGKKPFNRHMNPGCFHIHIIGHTVLFKINDSLILKTLSYNNNLQVKTLFYQDKPPDFYGTVLASGF